MVLPFLFSVLCWGERMAGVQWLGLAAAVGAVALLSAARVWVGQLAAAVFFLGWSGALREKPQQGGLR